MTVSDHAPLLERAFTIPFAEGSAAVTRIEGTIPEYVRGTYLINGPGRFNRAAIRYRHWLDGDGLICALHFGGDSVRFTSRFVRTRKFLAEEEANRAVFRTFGTAFPSDQLKRGVALESPANVSVYPFGGKLLAFGEQSLPYELEPETLETRGPFDFDGQLNELSPFAAHPKFDPHTGQMYNFGVSFTRAQTTLNLYGFEQSGRLRLRARHRLPAPHSIHDCGLSAHYVVFYLSPYLLDPSRFLEKGLSLMDCLQWRPEQGSRLFVISRETGSALASIPAGNRFCLHVTNCFEASGLLHIDVIELDRPVYDQYQPLPELFRNAPHGRPVRLAIDLEKQTIASRTAIDYESCPDFPSIDPSLAGSKADHSWMLGISATPTPGRKFFDELVHLDWREPSALDVYRAPALTYLCGEPAFIRNPGFDGQGVVIVEMFDACRVESWFGLFDAFNVAAGPLARIGLERPVPLGFHATFWSSGDSKSA
jgi:all-trans-8'-apo-beta-carotenal 15,15'-oxygenase